MTAMSSLLLSTVTVPGVGLTTPLTLPSRFSSQLAPLGVVCTVTLWSVPSTIDAQPDAAAARPSQQHITIDRPTLMRSPDVAPQSPGRLPSVDAAVNAAGGAASGSPLQHAPRLIGSAAVIAVPAKLPRVQDLREFPR